MDRVLRSKRAIALFVLPALIAYAIVVFLPMLQSIAFTFYEGTPNVNMEWVGLNNYKKLFTDKQFIDSIKVTLNYLVWTATLNVVLGLVTALLLAYTLSKRQTDWARTVMYLPVVIPSVAVAGLFQKIFAMVPTYGLINSLLDAVGLTQWIQPWLGQSSTALSTIITADVWRTFGYFTILFYAGWLNVPRELDEASRIDGCNVLQTIRHVVLPIIRPITVMCVVLAVTFALRLYDMPTVMTKGGPGRATEALSLYMYKQAFTNWKYGYGSTLAAVILILSMGLTQLLSLFDRKKDVL